jgi:catechol 2,3-dioxygenase-like lactoylglutathione lyase family enzyme
MIRVTDPEATIRFFELIGVQEVRRMEREGPLHPDLLAAPGGEGVAEVELTYNWPPEDGEGGTIPEAAISAISPIASRISTKPARSWPMPATSSTAFADGHMAS